MKLKLNEAVVEVPDDVGQAAQGKLKPSDELHVNVTLPTGYSYTIKYPIVLTEEL